MSAVFTPSVGGSITFADTGSFDASGTWRMGDDDSEGISAPKYGRDYPATAGVDGTGVINYGYRGQRVELSVIYVRATLNGVLADIRADLSALAAGASTLLLDGESFAACEIDSGASGKRGPTKSTGGGFFWSRVKIVVNAKR